MPWHHDVYVIHKTDAARWLTPPWPGDHARPQPQGLDVETSESIHVLSYTFSLLT